jgi:Type IV secretion system pilin
MTSPRPRPARRGPAARRPGRAPASRARFAAIAAVTAVTALAGVTALAAAAALTAVAQPALAGTADHVLAVASIGQVIANITRWIVGILAGLATLFLTIGGLRYLMAGGDPGEVERAKTALRSAAIGYGLAILAPVIVTVLKSLVGG